MNVQHVNATVVIESIVQDAIADDFHTGDGDEAVAGSYFTPDKLSALMLPTRDQVERAERFNITFNGLANLDHLILPTPMNRLGSYA